MPVYIVCHYCSKKKTLYMGSVLNVSPDLLISVIDNVIQRVQRYHVMIIAHAMKKATFIRSTCNNTLTSETTDTVHSEISRGFYFRETFHKVS